MLNPTVEPYLRDSKRFRLDLTSMEGRIANVGDSDRNAAATMAARVAVSGGVGGVGAYRHRKTGSIGDLSELSQTVAEEEEGGEDDDDDDNDDDGDDDSTIATKSMVVHKHSNSDISITDSVLELLMRNR